MTESEMLERINRYFAQPYTPRFRVDAERWEHDFSPEDEHLVSVEEYHELTEKLRQLRAQNQA